MDKKNKYDRDRTDLGDPNTNSSLLEYQRNFSRCDEPVVPDGTSKDKWKLHLFVFSYSVLSFIFLTGMGYSLGMLRTMEKRFGLPSTTTGTIGSVNDVVHISLVVFVGYIGRKGHKPRMIGSTTLFGVLGALLLASPYFIYGKDKSQVGSTSAINNNTNLLETAGQICRENNTSICRDDDGDIQSEDFVIFILVMASACNGVGGVASQVLGMAYVDENAEKAKSSLYIGIISSVASLGPIGGILLAAVCSKLPEDLQGIV